MTENHDKCYICLESKHNERTKSVCKNCTALGHYSCMKEMLKRNKNAKCGVCVEGTIIYTSRTKKHHKTHKQRKKKQHTPKCNLCEEEDGVLVPLCISCHTQCHISCRKNITEENNRCHNCDRLIVPLKIKTKRKLQLTVTGDELNKSCRKFGIFIIKSLFNLAYYSFNLVGIYLFCLGSSIKYFGNFDHIRVLGNQFDQTEYPTFDYTTNITGNATYYIYNETASSNGIYAALFLTLPIMIYSFVLFTPFRFSKCCSVWCSESDDNCPTISYPEYTNGKCTYVHLYPRRERGVVYSSKKHYMYAFGYLLLEVFVIFISHIIGRYILIWLYDYPKIFNSNTGFNWKTSTAGIITLYIIGILLSILAVIMVYLRRKCCCEIVKTVIIEEV